MNIPLKSPRYPSLYRLAFISFSLTFASFPYAQAAEENDEDEIVFELDPFRVEADSIRGYTATNATSLTMLDTALKDTPFAIDVVTTQFIEDTGSTDIREVLAYDAGVMLENTMERSDGNNFTTGVENDDRSINNNDTDVTIRGFRSPTLKNGFFTITRVDSINIGRFERASGPTSLLYGIGAISGITNIITKAPSDINEDFTRVEFFAGTHDLLRTTLDHVGSTGSFSTGDLNYRLNFAYQTEGDLVPNLEEEVFFIAPVIEYKPWESTRILFEVELSTRDTEGDGQQDTIDNLFLRSTDTNENATLLRNFIIGDEFVNISGPDAIKEEEVLSPRLEITQRIGENFSVLASVTQTQLDSFRRVPVAMEHVVTDFPEAFFSFDATLQDYIDNSYLEYGWEGTYSEIEDVQVRVSALYTFDLFGDRQSIVLGRQERSLQTDGPSAGSDVVGDPDNLVQRSLAELPIFYEGEELFSNATRRLDNQWYQGHYAIFQGSFLNKRILPVIGYRWDRTQTRARSFNRNSPDAEWVRDEDFLSNRGAVDGYDQIKRQKTPTLGLSIKINEAISIYGVYAEGIALSNTIQRDGNGDSFEPPLTKNKEFGLKFDFWDGKVSGRLTYFELEKEGGVRYSFYATNPARGKYDPTQPVIYELNDTQKNAFEEWSGISLQNDFGIEKTRSMDGPRQVWPVPYELLGDQLSAFALHLWNSAPNFDTWRNTFNPLGPYFSSGNNPNEDRGAYHNFNEESSGYEFRLNIRPIENWQTILSYSFNEVIITSGLANLAGGDYEYNGIHPVFYYTGGPEFYNEDWRPESYSGSLGTGTINNDTPQHTLRIWSKYSFDEGFLDGLEVALGYRYQSERIADSPWLGQTNAIQDAAGVDNVRAPVPEFDLWDLAITYNWEMYDMEWRIGMNIRNLFDEDFLEAEAANLTSTLEDGTAVPVVTRFYFSDQRNIRLSLRVTF